MKYPERSSSEARSVLKLNVTLLNVVFHLRYLYEKLRNIYRRIELMVNINDQHTFRLLLNEILFRS